MDRIPFMMDEGVDNTENIKYIKKHPESANLRHA